ncbi:PREDICTED: proline-serine-threonine phosphatase-interacting protein 1-like [Acropora digitifera]|uniref:proline-serine-threonine phosphatase-interacting protein 1-like n=1 Tax=Acropora digitifera TaxID=70779 RepID=UPI00077A0FDF|nr:PREDICTED: proline-serine-threonine phosphatase-interacting protein 1-like [Acropora digitifera]
MVTFANCFWGADFNSTAGFDVLCKRMRDGKQMCQDFEEFLRQRADAEEKYGKSLIRIAESAKGKEEIGTLKESWEVLRTETENMGKLHVSLAHQLMENLEHIVRDFRESQREKRKKVEESVKRAQRNKKNSYDSNVRNKRTYEQKCREAEAADEALKKSVSLVSKDEEKVLFQSLEEERIAFLRNAVWAYTNMASLNYVKLDEVCELVRKSLELCTVESDIHLFISMKQTGSERPERIEYENFYMTQSSQKVSPSHGIVVNISGPVGGTFHHSKETSVVPQSVSTPKMARNRPQIPVPDIPAQAPLDESMYSVVSQPKGNAEPAHRAQPKEQYYRASFDYEAQGAEELSFKAGDLIKLCYKEDSTWWCGEVHGKKGMFPKDFVE